MERPMRFGNQRCYEITDDAMKRSIKASIEESGSYSMEGRYSQMLIKTHLQTVRESADSYRATVGTFGKKYLLYLKKIDGKNFVFFINRKTGQIIKAKFTFMASLFEGTLAEGELVRTGEDGTGDWIFLINDLIYYEGADWMKKPWEKRNETLQEMIQKKYRHDAGTAPFKLVTKHYMTIDYAKSMVNDLMPRLKYKCSGLIFKHVGEYGHDFAYLFPDSTKEEAGTGGAVAKKSVSGSAGERTSTSYGNDFLDQLAMGCEVVSFDDHPRAAAPLKDSIQKMLLDESVPVEGSAAKGGSLAVDSDCDTSDDEEDEAEAKVEVFTVRKTEYPDVYELYKIKSDGSLEKDSYAAVSAMATSKMMRKIFADKEQIRMKCRYNSGFKRWVPVECV